MRELKVGDAAKPVAFGCWNLIASPAGNLTAAPQRRFLPSADWF